MEIKVKIYEIPKDKDGFFDDANDEMYNSLPILIFDGNDIEPCICDKDNWGDWLSDFSKERYKFYIKLNNLRIPKQ